MQCVPPLSCLFLLSHMDYTPIVSLAVPSSTFPFNDAAFFYCFVWQIFIFLKNYQSRMSSVDFQNFGRTNGDVSFSFFSVWLLLPLTHCFPSCLPSRWSYQTWPCCASQSTTTTISWLGSASCLLTACRLATATSLWETKATSRCHCPPSSAKSSSRPTCPTASEVRETHKLQHLMYFILLDRLQCMGKTEL